MREIKFRGKKTSTGEWLVGSLIIDSGNGSHVICQQRSNPVSNGIINGWCFGVIPETVGQFTGLKDKNGKEIYDGDVCRLHYFIQELGENLGVREGEKEIKATISIQHFGLTANGQPLIDYFDGTREHSEDHFEIIGNIHDQKSD